MAKSPKIGIMGGTFDPLHHGHLLAAETARQAEELDEVWFIPAHIPPHKSTAPLATAEARWDMLNIGIRTNRYFRADDIELRRGGPSYTLHTATALQERYPHAQFFYIIGADMVQYLPHWYEIDRLVEIVTFIGLQRAGYDIKWHELAPNIRAKVLPVPMLNIEISSTLIREKCSKGESIMYLVPQDVHDYIRENKLYEQQ